MACKRKLPEELIETTFPNGLRLFCLPHSRAETWFVYREIFEDDIYARHGITLGNGDCILDIGANIGMFVISAMRQRTDLRIYAFEPVPPIFDALQANVARFQSQHSATVRLFNYGVSNRHHSDDITFYPQSPANSTLYPAEKQKDHESKSKAISVRDVWKYDKLGFFVLLALYPLRHRLVRFRLGQIYARGQRFRAEFKPLSTIIEEQKLQSVDLLKIDVEGSEFDVLEGITDQHWERIKQLVVEISPSNLSRVAFVKEMLAERGFQHISLETMGHDEYLEDSRLACNVYARR